MKSFRLDKLKLIVHIAALLPLLFLIWDILSNQLSADPIREIQLRTGRDAFILLVLALSVTPLSAYFGLTHLVRLRRTLGVYAFFYASIHFLNFIGLDYGFDLSLVIEGIFKKYFAIFGFLAYLILIPLTITSTNAWKRRLGRNWRRLHRFFYVAMILALTHFLLAVKSDFGEPLVYGLIVIILLLARLSSVKDRQKPTPDFTDA